MVGGTVAVCDVEGLGACGSTDCDLHDVDGGCVGALSGGGAVQQTGEPDVGFDGEDTAGWTCSLGRGDGEESDVGADVPDGVAGMDELSGKIEEIGLKAGAPLAEACVGRDVDGGGVQVFGKVSGQDLIPAHFFGKDSKTVHRGLL